MASKMVAKKKILFFSKYMSSTQYQLWYNQIFTGFLMNVDDVLGKTKNFPWKYPKICKILVILYSHMVIFKDTRWSQIFRESNLFFLQEVSYIKMFGTVCCI